ANNSTTINGVIMDQGTAAGSALTVAGTGTLTLNGANSMLGGIILGAASANQVFGTLNVTNAAALNGGALTLTTGVLKNSTGALMTITSNITLGATALIGLA